MPISKRKKIEFKGLLIFHSKLLSTTEGEAEVTMVTLTSSLIVWETLTVSVSNSVLYVLHCFRFPLQPDGISGRFS